MNPDRQPLPDNVWCESTGTAGGEAAAGAAWPLGEAVAGEAVADPGLDPEDSGKRCCGWWWCVEAPGEGTRAGSEERENEWAEGSGLASLLAQCGTVEGRGRGAPGEEPAEPEPEAEAWASGDAR